MNERRHQHFMAIFKRVSRRRKPLGFATGDDPAYCGMCGKETSIAMIGRHLEREHGVDPAAIADARIFEEPE